MRDIYSESSVRLNLLRPPCSDPSTAIMEQSSTSPTPAQACSPDGEKRMLSALPSYPGVVTPHSSLYSLTHLGPTSLATCRHLIALKAHRSGHREQHLQPSWSIGSTCLCGEPPPAAWWLQMAGNCLLFCSETLRKMRSKGCCNKTLSSVTGKWTQNHWTGHAQPLGGLLCEMPETLSGKRHAGWGESLIKKLLKILYKKVRDLKSTENEV